ncbi:MAG TPA: hypothetical protein VN947_31175 [Polyangia bacterium]|nr:hypothetical protein [Polyangia bacterium]
MIRTAALLMMGTLAATMLGSCGGNSGGGNGGNPPVLWLAENGDELHVKLAPVMPNPF